MNLQSYPVFKVDNPVFETYKFYSVGLNRIEKQVQMQLLQPTNLNVYNLAMCDIINGERSYDNRTNNKDLNRVMQTIATVAEKFTLDHPDRSVYITADDDLRLRLYRTYFSRNIEAIREKHKVLGQHTDLTFEQFQKDTNYIGFLVKRK